MAEFLSGSDVFVNLPTGHGKPEYIIWLHSSAEIEPASKAAKPFPIRKHSRMQNLSEKKSEILQQFTGKKL